LAGYTVTAEQRSTDTGANTFGLSSSTPAFAGPTRSRRCCAPTSSSWPSPPREWGGAV